MHTFGSTTVIVSMKGPVSVHGGAFRFLSNETVLYLHVIGHHSSCIVCIRLFIGQQYHVRGLIHGKYWFASVDYCFLTFVGEVTHLCNGKKSALKWNRIFSSDRTASE